MKDIFSYNIDNEKTAILNWRTDYHDHIYNMIVVAEGYMQSALMLSKQLLDNNDKKDADIIIFPMLFSANHSIELYLKAIVWTLNILLKNGKRKEGKHNIKQIFDTAIARIKNFEKDKNDIKNIEEMLNNLNLYIQELFAYIRDNSYKKDNMDFPRYPIDEDYERHFYLDTFENVSVDLENFYERFSDIGKQLNRLSTYYLYEHLHPFLEMDNE